MKILFLAGAYNKAEAFASICKGFERLGHEVTFYPLYMRMHDYTEQLKADPRNLHTRAVGRMSDEIIMQATRHNLVLLWKGEMLPVGVVRAVTQLAKTVYYSWDDPYQLEVDRTAVPRAVLCHATATCCEATAKVYEKHGARRALWIPPGYDPEVHYEEGDPVVDVCFVATNTYCKEIYGGGKNPPFDRRDLVRAALEVTPKVELWGRGEDSLGWLHPTHGDPSFRDMYKGFINFEESRKAFSRARICVNSHVRRIGYKYFNERTFQIMGCKRYQLIDDNPGLDEVMGNRFRSDIIVPVCHYGSIDEFKYWIGHLLERKHEIREPGYITTKVLGLEAYEFSKNYTWDKFCARIMEAANG